MDIAEILTAGGAGLAVILLGLIKIPKLEINIWGWIARGLGNALNRDLMEELKGLHKEVDVVKKDLQDHILVNDERDAKTCRQRILRFNDEILDGLNHTKESYDCTLLDIDSYEKYCREHETFLNNKCELAINNIRETYSECLKNKKFN